MERQQEAKLEVAEMKMSSFSFRMDRIRNKVNRGTAKVTCFVDTVTRDRTQMVHAFNKVERYFPRGEIVNILVER